MQLICAGFNIQDNRNSPGNVVKVVSTFIIYFFIDSTSHIINPF